MIDVIIVIIAAECAPIVVLQALGQQANLQGNNAIISVLSALGRGNMQNGMMCLVLVQLLMIPLILGIVRLYYRWKFRKAYRTSEETSEAAEKTMNLPLSFMMRRIIFNDVINSHALHVQKLARQREAESSNNELPKQERGEQ